VFEFITQRQNVDQSKIVVLFEFLLLGNFKRETPEETKLENRRRFPLFRPIGTSCMSNLNSFPKIEKS
jgi:hypothetical protein